MITRDLRAMPFELSNNNNSPEVFSSFKRNRNESIISVSSASSCHSDSSEDVEGLSRKSSSVQDSPTTEKVDFSRFRSMSDGATSRLLNQEPFEVFPSLPDSVLDKMGLLGNNVVNRERLSDEELEQRFVALSLAFTIDAATIKDRCERQRRYRDQTEKNLSVEIERLIQKANRIQPLCIDAETTELLSALLSQIDIVMSAASHATISSERYGAVQHENRISDSVNIMIQHVNLLKQQRDSARRQLQYTKRVLQNSNEPEEPQTPKQIVANGKIITKRRASIATITQPSLDNSKQSIIELQNRKITRRTSDLSIRATPSMRNSRPSRLELGVDLTKIKENLVETEPINSDKHHESDNESVQNGDISSPEENSVLDEPEPPLPNTLRNRLTRRFKRVRDNIETNYDKWAEEGTIHEICCFCALMCFSISLIFMANILIEVELAKRGISPNSYLWFWTNSAPTKRLYYTQT